MDKQDIKHLVEALTDVPGADLSSIDDDAVILAVRAMILDLAKTLCRSGIRPELCMAGLAHALSFQTVALAFHIQRKEADDPDLENYDLDALREDTQKAFKHLLEGMHSQVEFALAQGIEREASRGN